jgi:hypothetical protein
MVGSRVGGPREDLAMPKPHSDDRPEATTYFELQSNRDGLPEPGESKPAPVMPPLPASSPWSAENMIPDEPTIDRSSEDGLTINIQE